MKKYIWLIVLLMLIFIPKVVKAEVIEITQDDFDSAKTTGETVKGITYDELEGYGLAEGEYKLGSDVVLLADEDIGIAGDVILDLNGKSINAENSEYAIMINNNSKRITINGEGTIIGQTAAIASTGSITINGGTFKGDVAGLGIMAAPNLVINGGTFEGSIVGIGFYYYIYISSMNISLSGGTFKSNENGCGGIGIIGNVENDSFLETVNNMLADDYIFYDELTYNQTETNSFGKITHSQKEISVIPIEGEYEIIEGENQTYNNEDLVIKADGDLDLFDHLLVDDEEVSEDNYTVESGSTIVTLKKEFIDSLDEGNHTVTFVYVNGQVSTTLTINNTAVDTPQVTNNPGTLDSIYYYLMIFISSIIMLIICKKKAIKNF